MRCRALPAGPFGKGAGAGRPVSGPDLAVAAPADLSARRTLCPLALWPSGPLALWPSGR